MATVLNFEQMNKILKEESLILVDVRNAKELVDDGKIPASFNVPLPDLNEAFQMKSDAFKEKYGFDLPEKEPR